MSRFTIETKKLLSILDDLVLTSSPAIDEPTFNGVYIYSSRGPWGEEPGDVDLFVGLSSTGEVSGNTWTPGVGEIEEGFWSLLNVKNIKFVFSPLQKKQDKENKEDPHMVDIIVSGGFVTVVENDKEEPTELQFPIENSDFPVDGIKKIIKGETSTIVPKNEEGNDVTNGALTLWTPALGQMISISKRRKELLRLYRPDHSSSVHVAQIGDTWRGAIKPYIPDEEVMDVNAPDSDLFI